MKTFKQKLIEWSIILLVACVSVFLVVNLTMKNTDLMASKEIKKSAEGIKNIQDAIQMQQQYIYDINQQLSSMDTAQNRYIDAIKENTRWQQINYKQLQQLRLLYDEKINTAGNYNYGQIDSFFSAKYNKQQY
jgi:hypothetical protein